MSDTLICCFPRSRSLWLSHYLTIPGESLFTHEACEFAGNVEEFWSNADLVRPLGGYYGNSDSANLYVLPAILAARPMTKVVWIDRNMVQVCRSLKAAGIQMTQDTAEMLVSLRNQYSEHFDMIIDFDDLGSEHIAQCLWEFVLPRMPFDPLRYRKYNSKKICYSRSNPMPEKDTRRFMEWVTEELQLPVRKER